MCRGEGGGATGGLTQPPRRYRGEPPETVLVGDCPRCNYYEKVRNVTGIADTVPLVSSEWGYSTCQVAEKAVCDGVTELRQAKFLARMTLANIAAGVAAQVWYAA